MRPPAEPQRDLQGRIQALAAAVSNRGDRGAFDELAGLMRPRLVALLRQRLRNEADAQDAAQAALLRWWEQRDKYDVSRPFVPWLLTLTVRLGVDLQRSGARRRTHEDAAAERAAYEANPNRDAPSLRLEHGERRLRVWSVVREHVSAETAEAMWLFYGEGLSASEIADVLGKRNSSVRVLLHRGREALREPMRQAGWAPDLSPASPAADPATTDFSTQLNTVGASA
ncbi:MAG: RNA polymerase sigma factor [Planctomycetota bacterium]